MRTESKLKRYLQYQQNNPKPRWFNIYAFLLNSFYFLYLNMRGWFLFYFCGSLFLSGLAYFTSHNFWLALIPILVLRLINALTADRVCLRYIKRFIEHNQDVNYSRPIIFFPIMARRFFCYNLISCGIYQFFWMFQNWKATKRDTRDYQIRPFWQSWVFGIFYIPSLLKVIRVNLRRNKIDGKNFGKLAYSYIANLWAMIVLFVCIKVVNLSLLAEYICYFLYFATTLGASSCLAAIQKRINFYNRKKNPKLIMTHGYQNGGIAILLIGFITLFSFSAYYFMPHKEDKNLTAAAQSVYQMTKGYNDFCKKQGYEMKRFAHVYQDYFQPEIYIIRNHLNLEGKSLEDIFRALDKNTPVNMDENILKDMAELKPMIIEMIISRKYHALSTEDFDIQDARTFLEKELTLPVICSEMDLNAYSIINKNQNYKDNFRALVQAIR